MPNILYDINGSPVYDAKDGWKDYDEFTKAALADHQRIAKLQAGGPATMKADPNFKPVDIGTRMGTLAGSALPFVGGAVGETLGPLGAVGGAGLGTLAKNYLRSVHPEIFGTNPNTTMGQVADAGTDVIGGALPGVIGPMIKGASTTAKIASSVLGTKTAKAVGTLIDSMPSLGPRASEVLKAILAGVGTEIKNPN